MSAHTTSAPTDDFKYDCFISYRRSDGTAAAQWLRRHLVAYRLPQALRGGHKAKLSVYLDTVYERATNDFFEQNIVPALKASRFLIVVATPDANKSRTDGTPNWVEREIGKFLETSQRGNVIVVRARGEWADALPGGLGDSFPNLDIIDAREASSGIVRRLLDRLVTPNEVFTLIAPLYGVGMENMPELRREETKRTRRRIALAAALTATVLVSVSLLGAYAWYQKLKTDAANQLVFARYLAWQSGVVASETAGRRDEALLLAIEAYRRDPSYVISSAVYSLMNRTALPVARLKHDAKVNAVEFSPDGRQLAAACEDGTLRVWDYASGRALAETKFEKPAKYMKFGPGADELTAAFRTTGPRSASTNSGPDPGFVASWRWPQNVVTNRFDAPEPVTSLLVDSRQNSVAGLTAGGVWHPGRGQPEPPRDAVRIIFPQTLSRSSKYFAAAMRNLQRDTVLIFEAESGRQLQSIEVGKDVSLTALAFSPDDERLLVGQSDGKTGVWQWKTKKKLFDHEGYSDPTTLELSPDGKYVAEIDWSITTYLSIWLAESGRNIYTLDSDKDMSGEVRLHARFSADSHNLVFSLGDSSVRVVRIDDDYCEPVLHFTPGTGIQSVALHPEDKLLATGDVDGWVTVWRLEGGGATTEFTDAHAFEVSPTGGRIALAGTRLRVLDSALKTAAEPALDTRGANVVRFSPSGGMVALGKDDGRVAVVNLSNPDATVWRELEAGEPKPTPTPTPKPSSAGEDEEEDSEEASLAVSDLKFSRDEKRLLVARSDGVSEVDLESRRVRRRLAAELSGYVTFSPDGSLLAAKEINGPLRIYSLESFQEAMTRPSGSFDTTVSFSPDGEMFAARSDEKTVTVWSVNGWAVALNMPVESITSNVAFDSTSTYFAVSDGDKVHLWNLRTKQRADDLVQRGSDAGVLAFHPTAPYLAVGYSDKKIRIWRVSPQPQIVAEIPQREGFDFGSAEIKFTPDGNYILRPHGVSDNPSEEILTVLPWQRDEVIRLACARTISKKLDPSVWDEYLTGQPYRETCQLP